VNSIDLTDVEKTAWTETFASAPAARAAAQPDAEAAKAALSTARSVMGE
jgi:hypothetical protein